nr:retrovirus-related Pol polyprotein from transposon TNT 1-94 [Tanacetum cinerariifolium]
YTWEDGTTEGRKQNRNKSKSWKIGEIKDKEVNMAVGDSDDALVCCVENMVEDRIIDSGALFHATYCKEELERFKLRSSKVCLVGDKTLDIASIGDVVLKTSFGTCWILKDVRYITGLKRRLILVGKLDEEGYHIGFGDQQWKVTKGSLVVAHENKRGSLYMVKWKVTKGSLVVAHENKRGSLYMVKVHPDGIGAFINGSDSEVVYDQRLGDMSRIGMSMLASKDSVPDVQKKAMALHLLDQSKDLTTMILLSKTTIGVANGIVMLKMVPKTPLLFGVDERLSRTFREESTRLRAEAPKMLWADSVSTAYLIYRIPYVLIGLCIPEEEWRGKDTSLVHLKAAAQMKCDTTFGIRRVTRLSEAEILHLLRSQSATDSSSLTEPIQKSQVVLVDIPENLAENNIIVSKQRLSSEITQSPGESSFMSKGSENSRSFEDSGRSDEEDSEDGAFSEEKGSENLHVRRSTRESRVPVSKESVQWKKDVNEEMVSLEKNQTYSLVILPARKHASQRLWMFKVKEEKNSSESCEDDLDKLDVKIAFLHGNLNEYTYMTQSEGFQSVRKEENLLSNLKKSLYGLKQALRQ